MDKLNTSVSTSAFPHAPPREFGVLLQVLRKARRISQLDLASSVGTPSRHISFLETGRAQPTRSMIARLSDVMGLSHRDRNALMTAAGFAAMFRDRPLEAPEMAPTLAALRLILKRHDPYGAIAIDRTWDVIMASDAAAATIARVGQTASNVRAFELIAPPRPNTLHLLFHPDGLRKRLANWPVVASAVLRRVSYELAGAESADPRRAVLDQIKAYPGVSDLWDREPSSEILIPLVFRFAAKEIRLVSTIATLGTAQDLTLSEIKIEALHPADDATVALIAGQSSLDQILT
ncbi:helix-turn-helix domain-containing protein [Bradyrhizobium prioriisuperbiae]|uniref:helix-turn-helix domain-containing protein n=1 Tax=Bradyrhizobium prioriisuperbiae TaxID=2854389 RepID=UPI0028E56F2B|nr:helix-turn-helix domain-containing protein [Bradyrhizobium prioritasuperba]